MLLALLYDLDLSEAPEVTFEAGMEYFHTPCTSKRVKTQRFGIPASDEWTF